MLFKIRPFFLQLLFFSTIAWLSLHALKVAAVEVPDWHRLQISAPAGLLQQVRKDYVSDVNPEQPVDIGQMQLLQISKPKAKSLYIVNTRLPGLDPSSNPSCGQAGCLFYGYIQQGNRFVQVLNGYINDFRLQGSPPVIQLLNQIANQLPCLQLTFYQNQSQRLMRSKLCFDGKEYQPVQTSTK